MTQYLQAKSYWNPWLLPQHSENTAVVRPPLKRLLSEGNPPVCFGTRKQPSRAKVRIGCS